MRTIDANWVYKMLRKAVGAILGVRLDSLAAELERNKLFRITDNIYPILHKVLPQHRSTICYPHLSKVPSNFSTSPLQ